MSLQRSENTRVEKTDPRYVRVQTIAERRMDNTVFLVNQETDTIFYLNLLGSAIWQLLAEPTRATEVVKVVRLVFPDTPQEQIAQDVHALLGELSIRNLIIPQ